MPQASARGSTPERSRPIAASNISARRRAASRSREHRGIHWDCAERLRDDAIRSAIVHEGFRVDALEIGDAQPDGWIPVRGTFRLFGHVESDLRLRIADGVITIACTLGIGTARRFGA